MPITKEQAQKLYGAVNPAFQYLQDQEVTWQDLRFNRRMTRESFGGQPFDQMSPDDYNAMLGAGSIQSSRIVSLGANQLASGKLVAVIDNGANPRGLFGRRP
jgi:hypothetical protein